MFNVIKKKINPVVFEFIFVFQHERREDTTPELKRRKEDEKRMFL